MKKLVFGVIAVLAVASLTACKNQNETGNIPTNTTVVEDVNNGIIQEKMTNEEMYGNVIDEYKKAISEFSFEDVDGEAKIEEKYKNVSLTLLMHVARYATEGVELTFDYYDIDNNGVDELLVGASGSVGAIYAYDSASKVAKLVFEQSTMERGTLSIYDNGVILSEGAGGAALHYYEFGRMAANGVNYELLEAVEEEYLNENEPPVYRDATTSEKLEYKSLDEVMNKYILDANKI